MRKNVGVTSSGGVPPATATRAPAVDAARAWCRRDWLFAASLMVAVFLAYQPAWRGGFIWDDDAHVTRPALRSVDGLRRIWVDVTATQQYYPLMHSAFWLQHRLWGDNPLGYHLVNLSLHSLAALLVLVVLRELRIPGAYLATAIFALHPVQVESVAWITELKNGLLGVSYLGTMWCYLRFYRTREPRWWALAMLVYLLGLLSKTVIAVLPGGLLVIFWWQRGRLTWQKDVRPLLPFLVAGVAAGIFTAWVERVVLDAKGQYYVFSPVERFLMAGRVVWFYLGKLFWPADLMFMYPRWRLSQYMWWQYLFPLATVALLAALWRLRRRTRAPLAAVLYFGGSLFPVLGFLNVYPFRYSLVADHFQYLACLGIITLVCAGAAGWLQRSAGWRRTAGQVACVAVVGVLAVLSWRQSRRYRDLETLYRTTLAQNPSSWLIHNNLGVLLAERGEKDEAIRCYRESLRHNPNYDLAHANLALILADRGQIQEAMDHYSLALRDNPDSPIVHANLGLALANQGKTDEAIRHYREALRLDPNDAMVHNNLGFALAGLGHNADAIQQYQEALRLDPTIALARYNWGNLLMDQGRFEEARQQYAEVARVHPDDPLAHYKVGFTLASQGKTEEARRYYGEALRLNPQLAVDRFNLGVTADGKGNTGDAIRFYEESLQLDPNIALAHNNLGFLLAGLGKSADAIRHYEEALRLDPRLALAHYNWGNLLLNQAKFAEAIPHYQAVLQIDPTDPMAHSNWGLALAGQNKLAEAIAQYRQALQINPQHVAALQNLSVALLQQGNPDEAVRCLETVLRAQPDQPSVLALLAWTRATYPEPRLREGAEAVRLAERACQLTNRQAPHGLDALAAAYAEAGRFPAAAAAAREAATLAAAQGNKVLAAEIEKRAALYQAERPYRQPAP